MVLAQALGVAADPVTLVAAFAGGLVSFLSPCVLPIVPGHLSLIVSGAFPDTQSLRRAIESVL